MTGKLPQHVPADLAARRPDWYTWPTTDPLWQLASTTGPYALGFGELRAFGPMATARFDPHKPPPHTSTTEAVLYAGCDLLTALAERFQQSRTVRRDLSDDPVAYSWTPIRPLRLVDLTDAGAVRLGASHVLNTGRKDATQARARGLRASWPGADGVRYSSAMTGRDCAALWSPAADSFPAAPAFALRVGHPSARWQGVLRSAAAELGFLYA